MVPTKEDQNRGVFRALRWLWPLAVISIALLIGATLFYSEYAEEKEKIKRLERRIAEQEAMIESIKFSNRVFVMDDVIDKVGEEFRSNDSTGLSSSTIQRIATISKAFEPYRAVEGDSLSDVYLSPERGQLLLGLVRLGLDTMSLDTIFCYATFAQADLQGQDLKHSYLAGADLRGADLSNAHLRRADLRNARLTEARLTQADLRGVDLSSADLQRADLSWAGLEGAHLNDANLNGAHMRSTQMNGLDLRKVDIRWTKMSSASIRNANLSGLFLQGIDLDHANLEGSDLSNVLLKKTDLSLTVLRDADLNGLSSSEPLLKELEKYRPVGLQSILKEYEEVRSDTGKAEYTLRLRKTEEEL